MTETTFIDRKIESFKEECKEALLKRLKAELNSTSLLKFLLEDVELDDKGLSDDLEYYFDTHDVSYNKRSGAYKFSYTDINEEIVFTVRYFNAEDFIDDFLKEMLDYGK